MTNLSKRAQTALNILKNGGYFRKQLETQYRGGEKFETRLRDKDGKVVKGFGFKTFYEIKDAGLLQYRPCPSSTVWPEEWTLREKALAA